MKPNEGFIHQLQEFEKYLSLNCIDNVNKVTDSEKPLKLVTEISNLN